MKVTIGIPAYNEENSIKYVFEKIQNVMTALQTEYFIIICNDGSTDNTLQEIIKYKNEKDIIINHKMNRGLGETIRDLC